MSFPPKIMSASDMSLSCSAMGGGGAGVDVSGALDCCSPGDPGVRVVRRRFLCGGGGGGWRFLMI